MTPEETLVQSLSALRNASRFSGDKNSYRKDNPNEYAKVIAYLDGGARPSGVMQFSLMGQHAVLDEDARRMLQPTPPGNKLRWAPPTLSNPVTFDLSNATRTSSALSSGQGRDLILRCREVLNGPLGLLSGWRHIVWIGGEMVDLSSAGSSGHVVPQTNSGTLHFEGIKANVAGDFFGCRFTNPIIQIQACDIAVSDLGTSAHADCFQTQYLTCDELRCDMGTFRTDYQGFFVSNEPQLPNQPLPSKVGKFLLSRWNFVPGSHGLPATYVFKAIPQRQGAQPLGPWELEDVWMPATNQPDFRVYPSSSGIDWAGNPTPAKCFIDGSLLKFNAACGISGHINLGQHADFAPSDAGLNYVSPGYQ